MSDDVLNPLEKAAPKLPPYLGAALIVAVVLGVYLLNTSPPATGIVTTLGGFILLSLLQHIKTRKKKPKLVIYWADIDKVRRDQKAAIHKIFRASNFGKQRLKAEVTERKQGGFVSYLRKDYELETGGWRETEASELLFITEAPPETMQSRWWTGIVLRVGSWTEDDIAYDWYTADVETFATKYHKLRR